MACPPLGYIAPYYGIIPQICLTNQQYCKKNCLQLLYQIPRTTPPAWAHFCDAVVQSKEEHVASITTNHKGGDQHRTMAFVLQGTAHSGDNSTTQHDNNMEFPLQEPKTIRLQNDVGINPSSRVKNTVPPQVVQDLEASCNSYSLFQD